MYKIMLLVPLFFVGLILIIFSMIKDSTILMVIGLLLALGGIIVLLRRR